MKRVMRMEMRKISSISLMNDNVAIATTSPVRLGALYMSNNQ